MGHSDESCCFNFCAGRLEHRFDEYLDTEVGNLEFIASDSGIGYSVFAVSFSQANLLVMDLSSGKVSLIEGKSTHSK